ncbi:MAG: Protein of unknown function (DUF805) [Rhodobacteraceae bacterium HLUCCO18]|nr:MAG: Protein of unknown function (DUF805) [Rhodobacteraceae bacterium HLUCCO18]
MGMFAAVSSVYVNMFNFSGRARRAEYWWYFLFVIIMSVILQGALIYWLMTHPQYSVAFRSEAAMQTVLKQYQSDMVRWSGYYFAGTLFLYWLPQLAVTVRRLHDTGRVAGGCSSRSSSASRRWSDWASYRSFWVAARRLRRWH